MAPRLAVWCMPLNGVFVLLVLNVNVSHDAMVEGGLARGKL
jgi:hypothetical protein